jgi:anthranilate phosphoribosyltransferase
MTSILETIRCDFENGRSFNADKAELFLDSMISETDEGLLRSLFVSWNEKGFEENEIYSIAKVMRERCSKVNSVHETLVDVVGTGGSKAKTFNVSTAAAFVVAGAAIPVAKHGNKAATSNSGSADVLEELGINRVNAENAERCLEETGICFMFAPNHHRLSSTLANVRRSLGFPTIFNCVGPLCNPAGANHQLIGVWSKELVPKIANALAKLGTKNSWVVHGSEGLDEITVAGPTFVAEVNGNTVREFEIVPEDFGITPQTIEAGISVSPANSAVTVRRVLSGSDRTDPMFNLVLLNSAAAISLTQDELSFKDASHLALDSIESGRALEKLTQLAEATGV